MVIMYDHTLQLNDAIKDTVYNWALVFIEWKCLKLFSVPMVYGVSAFCGIWMHFVRSVVIGFYLLDVNHGGNYACIPL